MSKAERDKLRARYGALFDELTAILFEEDPVGINFESNTDEYEPEAETILPRLEGCRTVESVRHVVHEEFVRWFGPDVAGDEETYQPAATRIWEAWSRFKG